MSDETFTTNADDGDIDFEPDEVEDVSTIRIPAGTYDAVIQDIVKEASDDGSKTYYRVTFETTDPDRPGIKIDRRLYLTEKALPYTKRELVSILHGPLPPHFSMARHKELFVGRPVRIVIKIGTGSNGSDYSEVDRILAPSPEMLENNRPTGGNKPPKREPAKMF